MTEYSNLEELEEIVSNDPTNFQARRELSIALLDKGYNEEALKNINYLLTIFPEDARLYYNQGIIFEKLNHNKMAEKAYKQAIELDGNQSDFLYNLGWLYLQTQKYDESLELFLEVLNLDENPDFNTFFNIGFLYTKKQEYERAIEYLKKAWEINNNDTLALFYTAYSYSCLKDFEKAQSYYKKVLKQCPDYSWAYFNLAVIEYNHKNLQSAVDYLQETLRYNPKDIEAYTFFAKILCEAGDYDKAESVILTGLNNCENDGNLYYTLGQINKLQGNPKGYVGNLKLAIQNHMTLNFPAKKIKAELTIFIQKYKSK